jgi:ribonuclease P protein 1
MEEEETDEMKYGLQNNTLFLRIYQTSMAHFYNSRLMPAIMFEPNIVFDCGYEDNMVYREIHNCAKQLQIAFSINRIHASPMHQYFCNLKTGGMLEEHLILGMPTFLDVDFPATVTSQSYLDLFPKDQLVYLTPHTKIEMTEYDPDMVYIIGAMVDKVNR